MIEALYYSVPEFCQACRIGKSTFYKLGKEEKPIVTKIGDRSLIAVEDARRWQKKLSAKSLMTNPAA
jgi:predicted DNA-binding transcriptional regulator AlpA